MAKKNRKQQRRAQNKKFAQTTTVKSKRNSSKTADNNDSGGGETIDLLSEKIDGVTIRSSAPSSSSSSMQGHSACLMNQPSGLPNLGNTCYFNSVQQVMAQTYLLHHYLRERCQPDFRWNAQTFYWNESKQSFTSESLHLSLPPPNSLIIDFLQLQEQIFARKSTNPRALLSDIQREKQQFEGYAQQDAQELLITLLDSLKKSEILRQKYALLKGLRIEDRRNPTAEDRENAQRYKITAKHTVIDSIFGGQLLSIIHCNLKNQQQQRNLKTENDDNDNCSSNNDDNDSQKPCIDNHEENPLPNGNITCSSTKNKKIIDDEFRYKFHLFAHERMCRTDEDYQNMDLGTLLRSFIKEETLDGSNKYLCENCSKQNGGKKIYSKATRCQLIALPPPILILQLKRFEASGFGFNKHRMMMHKLNTKISFPYRLYLAPYTSRIYEYFSRFYEPDCNPDDISDWNDRRLEYTLYAVVIHSGSLRFGHYMAYVCVRPESFNCQNIRRFLHLKPFVSDIEHIMQFVREDLDHRNEKSSETTTNNPNNSDDSTNSTSNVTTTTTTSEPDMNQNNVDHDDDDDDNDKQEKNRKWYFISDSSVSSITLESVLRDATSPYMLFYERTK
ncbi:Ubiquitin carboxyl-terminal hydrolase 16 [Dermatophagoides pteronyssinus]|uniref:ubiquitinyl hydrolase 1 n=1 Tax=Dermatophagoides pteronyssinus TaxID=6956 RepID=A0ABQ8IV94_DERPT|nr:Ubiquitin carboxyl-terminal hydrolase 16 [Dermatophagoides pteronyssinus]